MGIVSDDDDGQPKKDAYAVTDDGIAVSLTNVPSNACPPMYLTLSGMVTDVKDVQK